jgi:hypothetical protein
VGVSEATLVGITAGREAIRPAPETANHAAPNAVRRRPFVSPGCASSV